MATEVLQHDSDFTPKRALRDLRASILARCADGELPENVQPIDAIQHVVNRAMQWLRFAEGQVDELPENKLFVYVEGQGSIPAQWIHMETNLRAEFGAISEKLIKMGIAEKMVVLKEAEMAIMVGMIQAAMEEAGVPKTKQIAVAKSIRKQASEGRLLAA